MDHKLEDLVTSLMAMTHDVQNRTLIVATRNRGTTHLDHIRERLLDMADRVGRHMEDDDAD